MAGMLPGVEAARRRRFHLQNSQAPCPSTSGRLRRSSFCLYASSHDFNICTSNSFTRKTLCDESGLGVEAREAKKRLDERLQAPWRTTSQTTSEPPRLRSSVHTSEMTGILQAASVKKGGAKRLRWLKMRWKSSEQEECAVCLEKLKAAPPLNLMQLPCAHRFHTNCLLPWLEANAHCPCCRMQIPSSIL